MMLRFSRNALMAVTALLGVAAWTGCGAVSSALPDSVNLSLPDDAELAAVRGGGSESLASTEWALFDARDNAFLSYVVFDENGSLDAFVENAIIGEEVFGDRIDTDGASHPTTITGLSYAASTYGVENDSGFAFQIRAIATFAGVKVGGGRATAVGTRDGSRMEGTFSYKTTVNQAAGVEIPAGLEGEDEFPYYGVLVEE
ncbi:MAG: hypothetical protein IT449_14065 [Phycisphaerales bacterium]|nr:hypothetical protein [Phycisphaerales bacterium]